MKSGKRVRWWWGIVLIPISVGLVMALLLTQITTLTNPILSIRVDLATLTLMIGGGLSVVATAGVALWELAEWRHQQRIADVLDVLRRWGLAL